jgi:hypothetical protein
MEIKNAKKISKRNSWVQKSLLSLILLLILLPTIYAKTKDTDPCVIFMIQNKKKVIDYAFIFESETLTEKQLKYYHYNYNQYFKRKDPFNKYNFAFLYEREPHACKEFLANCTTMPIYYHIVEGYSKTIRGYAAWARLGNIWVYKEYAKDNHILYHEMGHAIGQLDDGSGGIMTYYSGNNTFSGWQKKQINDTLNEVRNSCKKGEYKF